MILSWTSNDVYQPQLYFLDQGYSETWSGTPHANIQELFFACELVRTLSVSLGLEREAQARLEADIAKRFDVSLELVRAIMVESLRE